MGFDYELSAILAALKQVEALQTAVPTGDQHALIIADSCREKVIPYGARLMGKCVPSADFASAGCADLHTDCT